MCRDWNGMECLLCLSLYLWGKSLSMYSTPIELSSAYSTEWTNEFSLRNTNELESEFLAFAKRRSVGYKTIYDWLESFAVSFHSSSALPFCVLPDD